MRIGDFCVTNARTYSEKEKWTEIHYLDTGNITENKISEIQILKPGTDTIPSRARRKVDVGDIIYSTVRPNQRHYGIIKDFDPQLLVSTGFVVITLDQSVADPDYIYYYLTQDDIVERLQAIGEQSTSAYPSIKPTDIENLELDLPPIAIQKQIGRILRMLDDKRAANSRINDNLQQQADAIFRQELLFDNELPAGWAKGCLLDIADYLNGLAMQRFRPADGETGLPVLKIKELRQGSCDASSELCSPSIKSEYIVHDGDVIFSWSGSLLVDLWCGGTCGLNQHLFKVTSEKYPKWFYYAWTAHHLARFVAIAADKATTMGHIKREELTKAEVTIPDAAAMARIGELFQPIYDLIISNRIENRKLATLRDAVLPQLMSGELDISDLT